MNFNDDFDFDDYDDYDGADDDFSEDMFEEEFEPESDQFDAQEDDAEWAFGYREAFILGGIVGQAYEEALDEKERQKQLNKEKKDEV
jgi:hypothetical protein